MSSTSRARARRPRRVPVMTQMSSTECGAACLAMVLSAYGHKMTVAECRERVDIGRDGVDLRRIAETARAAGMVARGVQLDSHLVGELRTPLIAHWGTSHYIVVERVTHRAVHVVDPMMGRRVLTHEEFDQGFSGTALEMAPGRDFRPRRSDRQGAAWAFTRRMLAISPGLLRRALLVSVILQLVLLLPPLATKFAVDTLIPHRQTDMLLVFGVGLALLLATSVAGTYLRGLFLVHLQARADDALMRGFFRHMLRLSYRYFQIRTTGDLIMRLGSNTVIREIITAHTISLVIDGLFVFVYVGILLVLAPGYAGLVLLIGITQFLVILASIRLVHEVAQRDVAAQSESQGYLVEAVGGAETVKASGAEETVYDRWSGLFHNQILASLKHRRIDTAFEAGLTALRSGAPLILLWYGTSQVMTGTMSLGTMLALNALAASLLSPLSQLASSSRQLQLVGSHLNRIHDVLQEPVEQAHDAPLGTARVQGSLTLRNVSFRYGQDSPWSLREVDLKIRPGEKVALAGRTGSGKSTLLKLVLGLYPSTLGEVLVDDRPLSHYDLSRLRRQFGAVLQEPAFFGGTIRENITFGNPQADTEAVVLAARRAQIHDEIMMMPMGYDTQLSEGGQGLSGGQRQRLALARALLREPPVLLLDEATSHLDVVTEARVDEVLTQELSCTRLIVAHRLSTVRTADKILVLDGGRIVESGTHAQLMGRNGHYRALVDGQVETRPIDGALP